MTATILNLVVALGGISVLITVLTWAFKKWVLPELVKSKKRLETAQTISHIASELVDALVARIPNNKILDNIDKVVDELTELILEATPLDADKPNSKAIAKTAALSAMQRSIHFPDLSDVELP